MGFEGGLGGVLCVGLDGKFELGGGVGKRVGGIGGEVVVEHAVDAEGDE